MKFMYNVKQMFAVIDIETRDPNLKTKGCGGHRQDGEILGIGYWDSDTEYTEYYDPEEFRLIFEDACENYDIVGANILYDLEWLCATYGIYPKKNIYDIQTAEVLLDMNTKSVSLDNISQKRLGTGKIGHELKELAESLGISKYMSNLHLLPKEEVARYCMRDVDLTREIWEIQKEELTKMNLWKPFQRESDIKHVLLRMRMKGIRIDIGKAKDLVAETMLFKEAEEKYFKAASQDSDFNPKGTKCYENLFKNVLRKIPKRTETGAIKTTTEVFASYLDPFLDRVIQYKKRTKLIFDFVDKALLQKSTNGRVHCNFHSLKADNYDKYNGAKTTRFSSTLPNLQQVPSRDQEYAPKIRGLFLPDEEYVWVKADYSQQEVRTMVHYGSLLKLEGAREMADVYRTNPNADFYNIAIDMCKDAGVDFIDRPTSKVLVLGTQYGMGINKTAASLKVSVGEARDIQEGFFHALPFVKQLPAICEDRARIKGFLRSMGGRIISFKGLPAYDRRKAWNWLNQGSCADMTKEAMRVIYQKHGLVPLLQVHDELDYILPKKNYRDSMFHIKHEMENVFKLEVPIVCDIEIGENWGNVRSIEEFEADLNRSTAS